MQRLLLIAMLALSLAACSARAGQPQPTAQVIERDGAKWVRVLDSGLEFPLLGEWEKAKVVTARESSGIVSTRFALDDSSSPSLIAISTAKKPWSEDIWKHIKMIGAGKEDANVVCERQGGKKLGSFISCDGHLFLWCKEKSSMHWAGLLDTFSDQQVHSIAFFGFGETGERNAPVFEQMMRRAEMH